MWHESTHSYVWHTHVPCRNVCHIWPIHMCDLTHSYVWQDSFIYVTRHISTRDMTRSYVWQDSFICVTCLLSYVTLLVYMLGHDSFFMCDVTHSYVWRDSFICVPWLIHMLVFMCDVTHSCVTWLIHMCGVTHWHMWDDSLICVSWLTHMWRDSFIFVTWLIHMCDITHSHAWHDSFICVTWLIHMCDISNYTSLLNSTWAADTEHVPHFFLLVWLMSYEKWHHSYEWYTHETSGADTEQVCQFLCVVKWGTCSVSAADTEHVPHDIWDVGRCRRTSSSFLFCGVAHSSWEVTSFICDVHTRRGA